MRRSKCIHAITMPVNAEASKTMDVDTAKVDGSKAGLLRGSVDLLLLVFGLLVDRFLHILRALLVLLEAIPWRGDRGCCCCAAGGGLWFGWFVGAGREGEHAKQW